jgi:hypothetical protein
MKVMPLLKKLSHSLPDHEARPDHEYEAKAL